MNRPAGWHFLLSAINYLGGPSEELASYSSAQLLIARGAGQPMGELDMTLFDVAPYDAAYTQSRAALGTPAIADVNAKNEPAAAELLRAFSAQAVCLVGDASEKVSSRCGR
jgi:hypothetical protein